MKARIAVLGGDGIGPEVIAEAVRVLERMATLHGHEFVLHHLPFGGVAIDEFGDGLPPATLEGCLAADGVLLGAIGGPKWGPKAPVRPEAALLRLRSALGVYANLRPVKVIPALRDSSTIKAEISLARAISKPSGPATSSAVAQPSASMADAARTLTEAIWWVTGRWVRGLSV